jgi:hypothetical protein
MQRLGQVKKVLKSFTSSTWALGQATQQGMERLMPRDYAFVIFSVACGRVAVFNV